MSHLRFDRLAIAMLIGLLHPIVAQTKAPEATSEANQKSVNSAASAGSSSTKPATPETKAGSSDSKPDSKSTESKDRDRKGAEVKPAEKKPAEVPATKPAETKPMTKAEDKKPATPAAPQTKTEKPAESTASKAQSMPKITLADLNSEWFSHIPARTVGPVSAGGRITDLEVVESDPNTFYVGSASGGVFKTTNFGTTFTPVFEREGSSSIGDVAVSPSNPDIVWVGTGEANARNSVSWGDGVYKSVDAGKTWTNMGLKASFQIGKIVVHPTDPNTVYVGALGRLWGSNAERGVFKTTDGGKTWTKVLFIDDQTGCIDLAMSPEDPNTLIACMYERLRDEFDGNDPIKRYAKGSGLHRTTDGGKTWTKLTQGLPTCMLGRTNVQYFRKYPKIVYALVESEKIGMGDTPPAAPAPYFGVEGAGTQARRPNQQAGRERQGQAGGRQARGNRGRGNNPADAGENQGAPPANQPSEAPPPAEGNPPADAPPAGEAENKPADTKEAQPKQAEGQAPATANPTGQQPGQRSATGFVLSRVVAGAPAEVAGMKVGDTLVTVAGKAIRDIADVASALSGKKPGDKVSVVYKRDGKDVTVDVTLADRNKFTPAARPFAEMLGGQLPNVQGRQGKIGVETGGLYRSTDGGDTWTRINSINPRPFYFSHFRVDPSNDTFQYVLGISVHRSTNGGKQFDVPRSSAPHSDHHALWIDPKDGKRMLLAGDGGLYITHDRMDTFRFTGNLPIAQFYHVAVDTNKPYRIYGGLQDNGSWGGPSMVRGRNPRLEDWVTISWGDGFVCRVDPNDPDTVYSESQNGGILRTSMKTGQQTSLRPRNVLGGLTRWNWNTPFILSSHNSRIYYTAANVVFKSIDRGRNLKAISGNITRTNQGSATQLAESPVNPDVVWVGSDDGALWVTKDGGVNWTDVTSQLLKQLPGPRYVSSIEPAFDRELRCYVALDGHRSNDDAFHLLVTDDLGKTWKRLGANQPKEPIRCLRQDRVSGRTLYAGTEFGLHVSFDAGEHWVKLTKSIPTVAVHEIAQPITSSELVLATHGRGIWMIDATPFRQISEKSLAEPGQVYEPGKITQWSRGGRQRMSFGNEIWEGQNPFPGAQIHVSLRQKSDKISLRVTDLASATIRTLPIRNEPGIQVINWDLRRDPSNAIGQIANAMLDAGQAMEGQAPQLPQQRVRLGQVMSAGTYQIVLTVNDKKYTKPIVLETDPEEVRLNAVEAAEALRDANQMVDETNQDADADADRTKQQSIDMSR